MEVFVKDLLEKWGLSTYAVAFEENAVDKESFFLLDMCTESMKELIPHVGPRMKFLKNLKLFKEATNKTENQKVISQTPSRCSSTSSSCVSSLADDHLSPFSSKPKKGRADFDIREILESHTGGDLIVSQMEKGLLTHKSRIQAVRILVSSLMEHFGERPEADVKLAMAKAIIIEFPLLRDPDGDGHEAWYTSGKGKHCAAGYIEERLRNVRKRSKERASVVKPSSAKSASSLMSTADLDLTQADITMEEVSNMVMWLKHNKEPLNQVKDFMAKTSKARAAYIRDHPEDSADIILREYPRLVDTPGMIEQDFRLIIPEAADKLFMKWERIYDGIIEYANKQNNWQKYVRVKEPSTDGDKKNLAIMILPCIFPTGVRRVKGKQGRVSVDDALKTFIDFQPIGTSIPSYLENVKAEQPFLLLLGDKLRPEQVFLIVERRAISVESLLKGVDLCFKLFYVLDISFPWQCATTWEFFQKVVYQLGEGKGKPETSGCVRSLRAFLNSVKH